MNLEQLLNYQHIIIYGDGNKKGLYNKILNAYPHYKVKLSETFLPKKVGPLTIKVKKNMYDLVAEDKALNNMNKPAHYLEQAIKILELKGLEYRLAPSLSYGQRERFSVILDVAHGKKEYLFYYEEIKHDILQFIFYLKWFTTVSNNHKLIFITNEPKDNVIMALKEHHLESLCTLFEYKNNELTLQSLFNPNINELDYYNADMDTDDDGILIKNLVLPNKDNLKLGNNSNELIDMINDFLEDRVYLKDNDSNIYYLNDRESINKLIETPNKTFIMRLDDYYPCIYTKFMFEFLRSHNIITQQQLDEYMSQLKPFLDSEFALLTEYTLDSLESADDEEKEEIINEYKENIRDYGQSSINNLILKQLDEIDNNIEEHFTKEEIKEYSHEDTKEYINEDSKVDIPEINIDDLSYIIVKWLYIMPEGHYFIDVDTIEEIFVPNENIPEDLYIDNNIEYKLFLYNDKPYTLTLNDDLTQENDEVEPIIIVLDEDKTLTFEVEINIDWFKYDLSFLDEIATILVPEIASKTKIYLHNDEYTFDLLNRNELLVLTSLSDDDSRKFNLSVCADSKEDIMWNYAKFLNEIELITSQSFNYIDSRYEVHVTTVKAIEDDGVVLAKRIDLEKTWFVPKHILGDINMYELLYLKRIALLTCDNVPYAIDTDQELYL